MRDIERDVRLSGPQPGRLENWRCVERPHIFTRIFHRAKGLGWPIERQIFDYFEQLGSKTDSEASAVIRVRSPLAQVISIAAKACNIKLKSFVKDLLPEFLDLFNS